MVILQVHIGLGPRWVQNELIYVMRTSFDTLLQPERQKQEK